VLGSLCIATYLTNASNIALTPFLLEIAEDIGRDLAAVGTMLGLGSVLTAVIGLAGGALALSDREPRAPADRPAPA
jgi:hypothetical protein